MNSILKMFLLLSVSGTVLIIILFSFKPILKNKIGKQLQYYLWLIVIIRLLFPFYIEINLNKSNDIITNDIITTTNVDNYSISYSNNVQSTETINLNKPVLSKNIINWALKNLYLIWIVISLIIIIRKITIYQSFINYIKAGQIPVNDINILDKLSIISQELKVNKAIELSVNPLVSSPLLIGFFRPCIVLPSINISETDLHYTLVHELVHYKRYDMFYKWILQFTVSLHWFNPFVYLMQNEIINLCELSCDEIVISKLNSKSIKDYGNTLINAMNMAGNYKENLFSITLSKNKKLLKERLDAIMKYKKETKITIIFSVILSISILLCATLIGAYPIKAKTTDANEIITNTDSNIEIVDIKAKNPPSLLHISGSNDGLVEVKLNLQSKIKDTSNLKLTMEKDISNFYPIFTKKGTITFDELNSGKGNFKTDKTVKLDYPIKEDGSVDFDGLIDVTYMIDNPIDKNSSNLIPLTIETPVKVISEIDGTHYWEAKDIVLYATTDKGKQKIIITISDEAQKPEIKTINENN